MKKQIPNFITLGNLLCGCLSIYAVFKMDIRIAGLLIFAGAILDFFDGMAARLLKVHNPIGKELDSLADVVTFGAAPGFIAYFLLQNTPSLPCGLVFIPFIIPLFSAYRLAKFNIDERQTTSFIGLPTPANAMIWAALPFMFSGQYNYIFPACFFEGIAQIFSNPYVILSLSVVLSVLLVSELSLFSLKFKNLKWKDNQVRFIFLGIATILIICLNFTAIPFIILLYILLSVFFR